MGLSRADREYDMRSGDSYSIALNHFSDIFWDFVYKFVQICMHFSMTHSLITLFIVLANLTSSSVDGLFLTSQHTHINSSDLF